MAAEATAEIKVIPGPKGHWLFGSLLRMKQDPLGMLMDAAADNAGVARIRLGPRYVYLVYRPALVKRIMVDNSKNYGRQARAFKRARFFVGNGLFTSSDELWIRQRRLTHPAFQHRHLATWAARMVAASVRQVERLRAHADTGEIIDIEQEMMRVALEIVADVLLSTDVSDKSKPVGDALTTALTFFTTQSTRLVQVPLGFPLPSHLKTKRAVGMLDEFIYSLIAERRKHGHHSGDLLDILMQARDEESGETMSDVQLRDEAMTIFVAGHETTAVALTWLWDLLARNPEAETALHQEVDSVLGDNEMTDHDLGRLPLTGQIISETLRLYPPAWAVIRQSRQQDSMDGFVIPADSPIVVSPYVTHRVPEIWSDPERFDPSRFAGDAMKKLPRLAYYPFGGGPHLCIGKDFALMAITAVVVTLARHFRFSTPSGNPLPVKPLITLRPRSGSPMQIVTRGYTTD